MNVSLTPELERFIQQKVASGMYHSASEVIQESLLLLQEKDALKQLKVGELRKDILAGKEQIEKGEYIEYEDLRVLAEEIKTEGRKRKV